MRTLYKNENRTKKWILFFLPLAIFFGIVACREELTPEEFKISELSLKTSDISELLPDMYNAKFNFSWTPADNKGTNSSISYKLEIDKKENNFSSPQVYEMGKNVYSQDILIGELNTLLVETYGAVPGTPVEMQARITATFGDNSVKEQSAIADFTLTPFKPFTEQLFIVGDATVNGWDIANATELTRNASNPAEFVYYGQLKSGNFKFAVNRDTCWCQDFYTKDPNDENKMVYNEGGSGADLQWTVDNAGLYKITVDILKLTIKIDKMNAPQFDKIWIVGDASPSGWNIDTPIALTQDAENPFIFTLECLLKEGNFKFLAGATGDWCGDWYRPLVDNQGLTETGMEQNSGCDKDYKWKVTSATAGRYKIILNTSNNTIKFEPVNVYLIGDATPNQWNMGSLEPMQKNGSIYTWTGPITAGEFKFTKFNTDWCAGTELVANTPNQSITNTAFHAREKCVGDDNKWKVTDAQARVYTFTLNLDTNQLTIE